MHTIELAIGGANVSTVVAGRARFTVNLRYGADFRSDPEAIRDLYRMYGGPVTTVARSIVRDAELAADVVQQTFVKAWRSSDQFDGTRELAPWLYAIARRTAIDALRSEANPTRGGHGPEVAMYTAMLAVENLHGASHDLWAVNTDLEYHEEQRVEPVEAIQATEVRA